MDGEQTGYDYTGQISSEINAQIRDIEERQRIMKDRLLLIGKNIVETKEKLHTEIIDLKKEIELIKGEVERLKDFLESVASEFSKFAKKEDLEILMKQIKMFQSLVLNKEK